jgi:hypothetical protein
MTMGGVKGETVHAVFAEIEQQRAQHDHQGLQRHGAEQPGQQLGRDAEQQRRNTAMTNEYDKHPRRLFGLVSVVLHAKALRPELRRHQRHLVSSCTTTDLSGKFPTQSLIVYRTPRGAAARISDIYLSFH